MPSFDYEVPDTENKHGKPLIINVTYTYTAGRTVRGSSDDEADDIREPGEVEIHEAHIGNHPVLTALEDHGFDLSPIIDAIHEHETSPEPSGE